MRSINVLRGTVILLGTAGAFLVYEGLDLRYYGLLGPGPGFFPIWIGSLLVAACLLVFVQSLIPGDEGGRFFPSADAATRLFAMVLSLVAVWIALKLLGFRLAILLFAFFVPHLLGRQSLITTVVVALIAGFGVAYLFETWLQVQLPPPPFGLLIDLGF